MGLWGWFLIAVTILVPVLIPQGPRQLALIDGLNVAALGLFLATMARRGRPPLQVPFLIPVTLISFGSLLSVTNARSVSVSLLTLLQDAYLYLWFLLLVNVMASTVRLHAVRVTWIVAAAATAVVALTVFLMQGNGSIAEMVGPRGPRATGTFPNPNYFADYLVLSFFVVLSAIGVVRGALLGIASLILLAGLVATKSNGGAIALLSGLVAWGLFHAYAKRIRPAAIAGAGVLAVALGLLGWSLVSEWGVGATALSEVRQRTFTERAAHSSESRIRIWSQLRETYARSPLGIGPGNSRSATETLDERDRPGAPRAKEAHSDYLGYAIERGPIAFVGLLLLLGGAFARLVRFLKVQRVELSPPSWGGAFAAALMAGFIASSVHSLVIEKLHFRHFWLYMAVLWVGTAAAGTALDARNGSGGRELSRLGDTRAISAGRGLRGASSRPARVA